MDEYGIMQPCDRESPPVHEYPTELEDDVDYTQLQDGNFVRFDSLPSKPVPPKPLETPPVPHSECVINCIANKLPNIGMGVILSAVF
jgi:hypothetical protein